MPEIVKNTKQGEDENKVWFNVYRKIIIGHLEIYRTFYRCCHNLVINRAKSFMFGWIIAKKQNKHIQ